MMNEKVEAAAELIVSAYKKGGKVLVCGNGGSAADSEHIVGELMKQFKMPRKTDKDFAAAWARLYPNDALINSLQGAVPAISLASQTSLMTALLNDNGGEVVFAQQVYGYGRGGDVLIALSTSGNSVSVINAVKAAKARGMKVIGFTGESGGKAGPMCDILFNVPEKETYRVQELHLPIYHALCALVEFKLWS